MSADLLREAAQAIREAAEAASPGPWTAVEGASGDWWVERPHLGDVAIDLHRENARHIALMDPTVALAVADLFATAATHQVGFTPVARERITAVARAALRRET
jgi:hypothetical protein